MTKYTWFVLSLFALVLCSCGSTTGNAGNLEPVVQVESSEDNVRETAVAYTPTPAGETAVTPDAAFHVSMDGDDNNNGGAGDPWRTIQHAVENVQPGDTILVHAGTYAGARIELSGTDAAPITLRNNGSDAVLLNQPGSNNKHDSILEIETWEGDGIVAHWVIEGLEISSAPGWGIDVRGGDGAHAHHIVIRNNNVHDNGLSSGKTGIFAAFTDNVTIEYNESHHNGEHGIYVNNSSDNFTIRYNELHHNVAAGVHLNGDASAGGDGIMTNGLVAANVIYENGTGGGAGINMDGVSDSVIENNLLYDNHATGIAVFQQDGGECSQNNRIWHNTILMPDDGRWAIKVAEPGCVDNKIFNNIFYSDHSYRGSINFPGSGVSGLESDYNVVVDRMTTDDGNSVITLAQWQALGYDANSFIAAPVQLFVNASGHDYHLQSGSPAIDAGGSLPDVTDDLDGNGRPAGSGYDIGAYEFQQPGEESSSYLPTVVSENGTTPNPPAGGHVVYTLNNEHLYRLEAVKGAAPVDLSAALDGLASGTDEQINISPDGEWIFILTYRDFHPDCVGWACGVLLAGDLSSSEVITTGGSVLHPGDYSAVASGGHLIVYPEESDVHAQDLWAVTRQGSGWSAPLRLTADSPYEYNSQPALSADGSKLLFDCGPVPYGQEGTAVCEVNSDGTNLRVVMEPADGPGGTSSNALHHADYAPDGSIIFEADWNGEQIWRLAPGAATPAPVTNAFGNDNSPCVLPDGRIVSLWLGRPDGNGLHEIKVMAADGSDYHMALIDTDVIDLGIGCGE